MCYNHAVKTVLIPKKDFSAYERFLKAHHADVHQSINWGELWTKLPQKGRYWAFAAVEGEEKDADWLGTALVTRYALPFGLCWLSIARGPVGEQKAWDAIFDEVQNLAKKEKAVFLRVELPEGSGIFIGKHSQPAHAHYHPDWTLRVDLRPDEAAILAQMKQKGRYNIRVAEKKGITLRTTDKSEEISAFYKILKGTGGRDGFAIHEEAYYQTFVKEATIGKWGVLYVAENEGMIVGGILVTFYGETAMYYYGASSYEYRALMAPYLLQWTAMRDGKKQGCKWYDFMGIAPPDEPNHSYAGITQFKTKFGGETVEYTKAREFVFRPVWYWVMRLRKALRG